MTEKTVDDIIAEFELEDFTPSEKKIPEGQLRVYHLKNTRLGQNTGIRGEVRFARSLAELAEAGHLSCGDIVTEYSIDENTVIMYRYFE